MPATGDRRLGILVLMLMLIYRTVHSNSTTFPIIPIFKTNRINSGAAHQHQLELNGSSGRGTRPVDDPPPPYTTRFTSPSGMSYSSGITSGRACAKYGSKLGMGLGFGFGCVYDRCGGGCDNRSWYGGGGGGGGRDGMCACVRMRCGGIEAGAESGVRMPPGAGAGAGVGRKLGLSLLWLVSLSASLALAPTPAGRWALESVARTRTQKVQVSVCQVFRIRS